MLKKGIIAICVVLPLGFLSIMVLVARFLWIHKAAKDNNARIEYAVDQDERRSSLPSFKRPWIRRITQKRERGHLVPTLSAITKAGDEGVYSSTLFDSSHGHPSDLSLVALHGAIANGFRTRPSTDPSVSYPDVANFISTTKRLTRAQSLKGTSHGRIEIPQKAQRNSIDLAEMGLNRSRSRKAAPVLVSTFGVLPSASGTQTKAHRSWTEEVQQAQNVEGKTAITITAAELAALSIVLGAPSVDAQNGEANPQSSALGISILKSTTESKQTLITLQGQKRSISQLPARGSGYSTLHAKHLACGSLPFSQDTETISSILITDDILDVLKSNISLHVQSSTARTAGSRYLAKLPSSKEPHFHTLAPSGLSTSTPLLLHAIADLPFTGGLTPLASAPLVKTVRFVASGGLPAARLLQRLDALVEKVHRHSPHLRLFGPLLEDANIPLRMRERDRLGKIATEAIKSESLADKVARMHRYITLLERLMHLVPDMKPHEIFAAVREATKRDIERSYEDAVAAYLRGDDDANAMNKIRKLSADRRHSHVPSQSYSHEVPPPPSSNAPSFSSSSPISPTLPTSPISPTSPKSKSPRSSSTFPQHNLGRQVEQILKAPLPFTVETVVFVARMVLVAWTLSVDVVAWGEGDEVDERERGEFQVVDLEGVKAEGGGMLLC